MPNKFNKISNTSNPVLTRAVIRQLGGRDYLEDVASPDHGGAESGYVGFTYYSDTVPFFERQRKNILAVLEDFGDDPDAIVMRFPCLRLSKDDQKDWRTYGPAVNPLLYTNRKVAWDRPEEVQVSNALSWFALEEVAREMVIDS